MDWRGKPLSFSQQRSQSLTLFFGFVMSKPFPDFIFVLSYWFRSCFFPYCLLLIGFPFGFSFVFHFGSQVTGLDRFLFSYLRFCFFFFFFFFSIFIFLFWFLPSVSSDTFLMWISLGLHFTALVCMCSRFCSVRFFLFETAGPLIFSRWSDSNGGVVSIVELYPKIASQNF